MIPDHYEPALNLHDTQIAIKTVKDFFQNLLAERLNLLRVSAPLFVTPESGLNDNLNGVERPVSFGPGGGTGGNRPFPGEMETICPAEIRVFSGRRALYRYERHPQGRGHGQYPFHLC